MKKQLTHKFNPNYTFTTGEILELMIKKTGLKQKQACKILGITEKHLSQLINDKAKISQEIGRQFERAGFGGYVFWMNIQTANEEFKYRSKLT